MAAGRALGGVDCLDHVLDLGGADLFEDGLAQRALHVGEHEMSELGSKLDCRARLDLQSVFELAPPACWWRTPCTDRPDAREVIENQRRFC
jgi:hypothetical protein